MYHGAFVINKEYRVHVHWSSAIQLNVRIRALEPDRDHC